MENLIYFAVWAVFLFLMMRMGCGAHIMGRGRDRGAGRDDGAGARWSPPERDTDPVCGKVVPTAKAKPSIHDGRAYYFCSRDCREIFEAAPEHYNGAGQDGANAVEHSHA